MFRLQDKTHPSYVKLHLVVASGTVAVSSRGSIIPISPGLIVVILVLVEQAGDLVFDFIRGRF